MANEVKATYPSGSNLYYTVRQDDGDVWYVVGDTFEDWGTDGRDMDDYDIAMTDETGSFYQANFDTDIPAGVYTVQIFLRETGTPLDGDPIVGSNVIYWTGSAECCTNTALSSPLPLLCHSISHSREAGRRLSFQ